MSKGEAPISKVLVVDDEPSVRASVGKILALHGFSVSLAANATEALETIARESFDLLLTDLRMPGPGDGLTVIGAMRLRQPTSVCILMSAYASLGRPGEEACMRPDAIVPKPFSIPALISLIRAQIEARRVEPVITPLETAPARAQIRGQFVAVPR